MKDGREGRCRSVALVERVGLEDGLESAAWVSAVASILELREMLRDLAVVPRHQDGLDVGEVFVERRSTDPGGLRDLRHRGGRKSTTTDHFGSGVERRIADSVPVRLDGLAP